MRAFGLVCLPLFLLSTFPAFALVAGDIDTSGSVDVLDVQLVINAALGLAVPYSTDIDYSGQTDAMDVQLVINAALALDIDTDKDGLCNGAEAKFGTDPAKSDTDGDGVSDGQEVQDGTDPLVPNNQPLAAFTARSTAGTAPLTVEFEDLSVAGDSPIDTWAWDFGDGSAVSSERNPEHTYNSVGIYTVTLTVRSGPRENQIIKAGAINVSTTIDEAFDKFVDPTVPAGEAADDMFAAMDAAFQNGGVEEVQQELDAARYAYFNNGGDPLFLTQRSEETPPKVLSLNQIQKRRLLKSSGQAAKSPDDINLPEGTVCSNVFIHINGINTDAQDAKMNYFALKGALRGVMAEKDAEGEFVYNPTACHIFRLLGDIKECTVQKWQDLFTASRDQIQSNDPLVQALAARIQAHVAKGRNVIIVPHSQGNFYTEQALWMLSAGQRQKVSVVETASPVTSWLTAQNDFRVDIERDYVAKLSLTRYTYPPLPYEGAWGAGTWISWWTLGKYWPSDLVVALEHHNFQGAYMMGQAGQTIVNKVRDFCVLPAPTLDAFSVNNKASSTSSRTVTLNNKCTRSPKEYMASESASFSGASWLTYSQAPSFRITSSGNGTKTIHFKVRNADGLESDQKSAQIALSEQVAGPDITTVSPNPVPGSANAQTLVVNGAGFVQGCTVRLRDYTDKLEPWTKSATFVNAGKLTLSAKFGATASYWTAQVINPDGTLSSEFDFAVSTAQAVAPAVKAFVINAGYAETVAQTVTLNSVCTGSPTHYMASESPSFSGASWQTYSTAPLFTLSSGNMTKTVWFKVKNAEGESNVMSDTITLNESTGTEETVLLPGGVPLVMVWCPAGTFMMGSPDTEQDRWSSEGPQHSVTLSGFWMGKYELTKRQWVAVMGTTPWSGQSSVLSDLDSPAVYVSWNDAKAFIAALNSYTGKTFRLPSESEWEYACRADTTTRFYWGDDPSYTVINDYAWNWGNCSSETYAHVVGQKLPNASGLYDMSGNVWEWCEDDWHGSYTGAPTDGAAWVYSPRGSNRMHRGGSWSSIGNLCRSAVRIGYYPSARYYDIGFRLSR